MVESSATSPGRDRPSRRHPIGRRLLFSAACVAVLAAGLEVAARVFVPADELPLLASPLTGSPEDLAPGLFRFDPETFWEPVPNLSLPNPSVWGDVTNSRGLRGAEEISPLGARPGLRVVCLGDSCTYGLGLPAAEAWPAQLAAASGFEVVNAAVPGYSTWQGLRRWEQDCADLEPDVVVVQFGNNDCSPWPAQSGDETRFPSDAERASDLRLRKLAGVSRFLTSVLAWAGRREPAVPGAIDVSDIEHAPARVELVEFRENLDDLSRSAPIAVSIAWVRRASYEDAGADPLRRRYRPYRNATLARAARGDSVVDVEEVFRRSGLPPEALFLDDVHATEAGSALIAEAVREEIARRRDRAGLPRRTH